MTIHNPSNKQTIKTQNPEISQNNIPTLQSSALDPKTWETIHPPLTARYDAYPVTLIINGMMYAPAVLVGLSSAIS